MTKETIDDLRDETARLRSALRSVTDYLEDLLDAGRFPPKGRSTDDRDAMVGWWEDRYAAIQTAQDLLRSAPKLMVEAPQADASHLKQT